MRAVYIAFFSGCLLLLGAVRAPVVAQEATRVDSGYEVEIEHRFVLGGDASSLKIERYTGNIELRSSGSAETIITEIVLVNARNEDEARESGIRFFSDVSTTGTRLTVRGTLEHAESRRLHISLAENMGIHAVSLAGDISVSGADAGVDVRTGSGDVQVENVQAPVDLFTGAGNITVTDTQGPVEAISGAGNLTVRNIADQVEIRSGAGDLQIGQIQGAAKLSTGGGDIRVNGVLGAVTATTGGGDIVAASVGGMADLATFGGSIEVRNIEGDLSATTVGGDITGATLGGAITAESMAGDIEFLGVRAPIVVSTTVGNITVEIREASFLRDKGIDIRTENGDINLFLPQDTDANIQFSLGFDGTFDPGTGARALPISDMEQDVRQGRVRRVKGRLNRGGGLIELRTQMGEISIEARGGRSTGR